MAHGSQKRACPHGTNAKSARGATRHTSQHSSEVDAADDSDAILVVNGQFSGFYSAVIIRQGLFSPSVQPLFDLVLKLHGLTLSSLAMSGLAISASPQIRWLLPFVDFDRGNFFVYRLCKFTRHVLTSLHSRSILLVWRTVRI